MFGAFKKPTLTETLKDKIETHERCLVTAEENAGYYRHMAEYHRESLKRLRLQERDVEAATLHVITGID